MNWIISASDWWTKFFYFDQINKRKALFFIVYPLDVATKMPYEPMDVPVPTNPNKYESKTSGSTAPKPKPKPIPVPIPKPKIEVPTYYEPPSMLL